MAKGAEGAAHQVIQALEATGGRAGMRANSARNRVNRLRGRAGTRIAESGAQLGVKGSKLGLKGLVFGAKMAAHEKLGPAAMRVRLANTSRELAHETSDLGEAVSSLNALIRANRRVGARSRTRFIGGIAVGAALMYHLDIEHGKQRRATTALMLARMVTGGSADRRLLTHRSSRR